MKAFKYNVIPTTVYCSNIALMYTPDVIEGFKAFIRQGENARLNILISPRNEERILLYKDSIIQLFKSHIDEIMGLLSECGLSQFRGKTDFLLFIRFMVDSIQTNIDGAYEVELGIISNELRVVQ